MQMATSVKVLRTVPELDGIRREWQSWIGSRESEMDSYLTFLQSNGATVRPHVVVVEREGVPDAILVGRIDRGHIHCRVGYLQLNLPANILCCVYGALRGNASKENCELIVSSVLQSLSDREGDVAYMNFLREDSELCRLVKERPSRLTRDYFRTTQPHYTAAIPANAEEFYRGLSSGARWQARSKQKKLLKEFGSDVKVRCFQGVSELDEMIQDVEKIARKSYQRGVGVGFVDTATTRDYMRLKASRGRLRAYVLYLRGEPCAFWIGEINRGTFESDDLGYDSAFGKYSPGMFLILKVIEGFCDGRRDGVTEVDFNMGHAQYKQVLSSQEWLETSVHIFAPTITGVGLNLVRSPIVAIDRSIKKALLRTNLLQKVKKAWREHARPKATVQADV
jgi:Acetyltransferase (GNAT) domain